MLTPVYAWRQPYERGGHRNAFLFSEVRGKTIGGRIENGDILLFLMLQSCQPPKDSMLVVREASCLSRD